MNKRTIAVPMMTLVQLMASPLVLAQAGAELDITISVVEEGQTPAEFIQELTLPPPEFFATEAAELTAIPEQAGEVAAALAIEVTEVTGTATETLTNTVRETISIDGTAAIAAEATLLPDAIVDVLDEDLPLVDTLQDALDTGAGGVVPPLDEVVGGIDDVIGGVTDDVAGDADGIVDDLGIVDNLDPGLDVVVPPTGELTDSLSLAAPDSTSLRQDSIDIDAIGEAAPEADVEAVRPPEPITDEAVDLPGADSLDTLPGDLPDLLP